MCDIYFEKCKVRGCKTSVDLHLADFSTGRDEIVVFCGKHLKEAAKHKRGMMRTEFTWVEKVSNTWTKKGKYGIAIVPLTKNAEQNWDGNHPNTAADMRYVHYEDGKKKLGKL